MIFSSKSVHTIISVIGKRDKTAHAQEVPIPGVLLSQEADAIQILTVSQETAQIKSALDQPQEEYAQTTQIAISAYGAQAVNAQHKRKEETIAQIMQNARTL